MNSPLVSIITPSLNSGAHLPDCLASLSAQTYPNLEHVVVDGESQDGSVEILARHSHDRLRVFVRRDRSMYDAINFGIEASGGEIIACLNGDDLYFPDAVAQAVAFLEARPEVDIAYGDQLSLFTTTQSFDLGYYPSAGADAWGRVLVYISQPSVFLRRRIVERVGLFDANLKAAADFDYWIRAFHKGAVFRKFRRVGVIVRMHGSNLSLSDTWQREHELLKDRYLPSGRKRRFWEAIRMTRRHVLLNRLSFPLFLRHLPPEWVRFHPARYLGYIATRRKSAAPILSVDLPYFRYDAFRALCLEK